MYDRNSYFQQPIYPKLPGIGIANYVDVFRRTQMNQGQAMIEYMIISLTLVLALACFVYWNGYDGSGNFKTVLETRTYQVIETLQQPTP